MNSGVPQLRSQPLDGGVHGRPYEAAAAPAAQGHRRDAERAGQLDLAGELFAVADQSQPDGLADAAFDDVDPDELTDIVAAVGEGRVDRAFELTPPDLAERLSVAGTPQECAAKIRSEIAGTGVNHMVNSQTSVPG